MFEGCQRFSNPEDSIPLDFINHMLFSYLDALFDVFSVGLTLSSVHNRQSFASVAGY